jgi:O-antigen/teichoic acid export membrane protein
MIRLLAVVASAVLSAAIGFAATVVIARGFGTADFGFFASLIAVWALLAPVLGLGSGKLILRAQAQDNPSLAVWLLGRGLLVIAALLALVSVAVAVIGPRVYERETLVFILASMALVSLVLQDPTKAVFQARDRYFGLAGWQLLPPLARLTAGGGAVIGGLSFAGFLGAYALAELLVVAVSLAALLTYRRHARQQPNARHPHPSPAAILQQGLPFAVSGMLYTIYYQIDVVMLGVITGLDQAGIYKSAFVFVAAAYLLPSTFFQRFLLSRIFRWWETAIDLKGVVQKSLLGCLIFATAVAGAFALLADGLVLIAFGQDYAQAAIYLRWLGLAVICHTMAIGVGSYLISPAGIRRKVRVQVATAAFNVAANLLLIPSFGIMGAVTATIATEAILLAGYAAMLSRELGDRRNAHADAL